MDFQTATFDYQRVCPLVHWFLGSLVHRFIFQLGCSHLSGNCQLGCTAAIMPCITIYEFPLAKVRNPSQLSSQLMTYFHWLVVWNIFFIFPYIGNVIIPIDLLIFFRGVCLTTNQSRFHQLSPRQFLCALNRLTMAEAKRRSPKGS